ncbi:MAG: hypothetical protein ACRDJM_07935 [Actinomycetota bacterium]
MEREKSLLLRECPTGAEYRDDDGTNDECYPHLSLRKMAVRNPGFPSDSLDT